MAASPAASLHLAPPLRGVPGPLSEPRSPAGESPLQPLRSGLSSEKPSLPVLWRGVSSRAFCCFCPRRSRGRQRLSMYVPSLRSSEISRGHTSHCCVPAQGLAGVTAFGSAAR